METKADTYYWDGGTGNWSDLTHWYTAFARNPPSAAATLPGPNDTVYFDNRSLMPGSGAYMVTLDLPLQEFHTMEVSGTDSPTFVSAGPVQVDAYGSMALTALTSYNVTGTLNFFGSGAGHSITAAGNTFLCDVHFASVGGGSYTLNDAFTTTERLGIERSTVTASAAVSCGFFDGAYNNTITRGINLGANTLTITGTGLSFDLRTTDANFTFSSAGLPIPFTGAASIQVELGQFGRNLPIFQITACTDTFNVNTFNDQTQTFNLGGFIYTVPNGSLFIDQGTGGGGAVKTYGTIVGSDGLHYIERNPDAPTNSTHNANVVFANNTLAEFSGAGLLFNASVNAGTGLTWNQADSVRFMAGYSANNQADITFNGQVYADANMSMGDNSALWKNGNDPFTVAGELSIGSATSTADTVDVRGLANLGAFTAGDNLYGYYEVDLTVQNAFTVGNGATLRFSRGGAANPGTSVTFNGRVAIGDDLDWINDRDSYFGDTLQIGDRAELLFNNDNSFENVFTGPVFIGNGDGTNTIVFDQAYSVFDAPVYFGNDNTIRWNAGMRVNRDSLVFGTGTDCVHRFRTLFNAFEGPVVIQGTTPNNNAFRFEDYGHFIAGSELTIGSGSQVYFRDGSRHDAPVRGGDNIDIYFNDVGAVLDSTIFNHSVTFGNGLTADFEHNPYFADTLRMGDGVDVDFARENDDTTEMHGPFIAGQGPANDTYLFRRGGKYYGPIYLGDSAYARWIDSDQHYFYDSLTIGRGLYGDIEAAIFDGPVTIQSTSLDNAYDFTSTNNLDFTTNAPFVTGDSARIDFRRDVHFGSTVSLGDYNNFRVNVWNGATDHVYFDEDVTIGDFGDIDFRRNVIAQNNFNVGNNTILVFNNSSADSTFIGGNFSIGNAFAQGQLRFEDPVRIMGTFDAGYNYDIDIYDGIRIYGLATFGDRIDLDHDDLLFLDQGMVAGDAGNYLWLSSGGDTAIINGNVTYGNDNFIDYRDRMTMPSGATHRVDSSNTILFQYDRYEMGTVSFGVGTNVEIGTNNEQMVVNGDFVLDGNNRVRFNNRNGGPLQLNGDFVTNAEEGCQGRYIYFQSTNDNNDARMNLANPQTLDFIMARDINVLTNNMTINKGLDYGNNDGITFLYDGSRTPLTFHWIGGTPGNTKEFGNNDNWSNPSNWSTTGSGDVTTLNHCIPRAQDDVIFDANSFSVSGQVVYIENESAACAAFTFTDDADNPVFDGDNNSNLHVHGDFTLLPNVVWSLPEDVYFSGSTVNNIIVAGHTFNDDVVFRGTGEWLLQDPFAVADETQLRQGTLRMNGQPMTTEEFYAGQGYESNLRHFDMRGSVLTLTGQWNIFDIRGNNANLTMEVDNVSTVTSTTTNTARYYLGYYTKSLPNFDFANNNRVDVFCGPVGNHTAHRLTFQNIDYAEPNGNIEIGKVDGGSDDWANQPKKTFGTITLPYNVYAEIDAPSEADTSQSNYYRDINLAHRSRLDVRGDAVVYGNMNVGSTEWNGNAVEFEGYTYMMGDITVAGDTAFFDFDQGFYQYGNITAGDNASFQFDEDQQDEVQVYGDILVQNDWSLDFRSETYVDGNITAGNSGFLDFGDRDNPGDNALITGNIVAGDDADIESRRDFEVQGDFTFGDNHRMRMYESSRFGANLSVGDRSNIDNEHYIHITGNLQIGNNGDWDLGRRKNAVDTSFVGGTTSMGHNVDFTQRAFARFIGDYTAGTDNRLDINDAVYFANNVSQQQGADVDINYSTRIFGNYAVGDSSDLNFGNSNNGNDTLWINGTATFGNMVDLRSRRKMRVVGDYTAGDVHTLRVDEEGIYRGSQTIGDSADVDIRYFVDVTGPFIIGSDGEFRSSNGTGGANAYSHFRSTAFVGSNTFFFHDDELIVDGDFTMDDNSQLRVDISADLNAKTYLGDGVQWDDIDDYATFDDSLITGTNCFIEIGRNNNNGSDATFNGPVYLGDQTQLNIFEECYANADFRTGEGVRSFKFEGALYNGNLILGENNIYRVYDSIVVNGTFRADQLLRGFVSRERGETSIFNDSVIIASNAPYSFEFNSGNFEFHGPVNLGDLCNINFGWNNYNYGHGSVEFYDDLIVGQNSTIQMRGGGVTFMDLNDSLNIGRQTLLYFYGDSVRLGTFDMGIKSYVEFQTGGNNPTRIRNMHVGATSTIVANNANSSPLYVENELTGSYLCSSPVTMYSTTPGNDALIDLRGGKKTLTGWSLQDITLIQDSLIIVDGVDAGNNDGNLRFESDRPSATFYWVGGTIGNPKSSSPNPVINNMLWTNPLNWSLTSGASDSWTVPNECIPSLGDNVVFDDRSFEDGTNTDVIVDLVSVSIDSMRWTLDVDSSTFDLANDSTNRTFRLFGDLTFAGDSMENWYEGQFIFLGEDSLNITVNGAQFYGPVLFDEWNGQWHIHDDLDLNSEDGIRADFDLNRGMVISHADTIALEGDFNNNNNNASRGLIWPNQTTLLFDGPDNDNEQEFRTGRDNNPNNQYWSLIVNRESNGRSDNETVRIERKPIVITQDLLIENGRLYDDGRQVSKDMSHPTGEFIVDKNAWFTLGSGSRLTIFPEGWGADSTTLMDSSYIEYNSNQMTMISDMEDYGFLYLSGGSAGSDFKYPEGDILVRNDFVIERRDGTNGDRTYYADSLTGGQITGTAGHQFVIRSGCRAYFGGPTKATQFPLNFDRFNIDDRSEIYYDAGVDQVVKGLDGGLNDDTAHYGEVYVRNPYNPGGQPLKTLDGPMRFNRFFYTQQDVQFFDDGHQVDLGNTDADIYMENTSSFILGNATSSTIFLPLAEQFNMEINENCTIVYNAGITQPFRSLDRHDNEGDDAYPNLILRNSNPAGGIAYKYLDYNLITNNDGTDQDEYTNIRGNFIIEDSVYFSDKGLEVNYTGTGDSLMMRAHTTFQIGNDTVTDFPEYSDAHVDLDALSKVIYNAHSAQTVRGFGSANKGYGSLTLTQDNASLIDKTLDDVTSIQRHLTVNPYNHFVDAGFQITGNDTGQVNMLANTEMTIGNTVNATRFPLHYLSDSISLDASSVVYYHNPEADDPQLVRGDIDYGSLELAKVGGGSAYVNKLFTQGPTGIQEDMLIGTLVAAQDSGYQITGTATGQFTMNTNSRFEIGNSVTATEFPINFVSSNVSMATNTVIDYNAQNTQQVSHVPNYWDIELSGAGLPRYKEVNGGDINIRNNLTSFQATLDVTAANDYNINIQGDWNCNSCTHIPREGVVTFDGTATQTISADNQPFYDVVFNNSSVAGLVINADHARIQNQADFTDGLVTTTNTASLFFEEDATALNASDASHVVGPAYAILGNGDDFDYPVGDGTRYRMAGVFDVVSTDTTVFRVNYVHTNPTNDGYASTSVDNNLTHASFVEYWNIDNFGSNMNNAQVKLSYDNAYSGGVGNCYQLRVARWNGSMWESSTGGPSGSCNNTSGEVVSTSAFNNFSPFTLGTIWWVNPLPVELVDFGAHVVDNEYVDVHWSVVNEKEVDKYIVERSSDKEDWASVGQLDALNQDGEESTYNVEDLKPLEGVSYYRLVTVEDGKRSYSRPVPVEISAAEQAISLYPNPVSSGPLTLELGSYSSQDYFLYVVDVQGREVGYRNETFGQQSIQFNTQDLPSGQYFIYLVPKAGGSRVVKSFIKQ